ERRAVDASAGPAWVYKRDGRLVPFERDKIGQGLFAASEAMGQSDAFLVREIADGGLHFVAREDAPGEVPTAGQIEELVANVDAELGHAALAQAFARQKQARRLDAVAPGQAPRDPAAAGGPQQTVHFEFDPSAQPAEFLRSCWRAYGLHAIFSRDL